MEHTSMTVDDVLKLIDEELKFYDYLVDVKVIEGNRDTIMQAIGSKVAITSFKHKILERLESDK